MSPLRVAGLMALLLLAGCARPPHEAPVASAQPISPYASIDMTTTASIGPAAAASVAPAFVASPSGTLAGRVLDVAQTSDIALRPGEVILTFDDGPRPGRTSAILDTLDLYGVKATFLMVGRMAAAHPRLAQDVALRGHTIGTHTYDHANLSTMSEDDALAEVRRGQTAVSRALAPIGDAPSAIFRFPYLAQTQVLRASLLAEQAIVLGVDIDSKDYFTSTPDEVMARTLDRINKRGRGVVLFHDVHARTVAMLPGLLQALQDQGYKVVTLRAKGNSVFDQELVTADAAPTSAAL